MDLGSHLVTSKSRLQCASYNDYHHDDSGDDNDDDDGDDDDSGDAGGGNDADAEADGGD